MARVFAVAAWLGFAFAAAAPGSATLVEEPQYVTEAQGQCGSGLLQKGKLNQQLETEEEADVDMTEAARTVDMTKAAQPAKRALPDWLSPMSNDSDDVSRVKEMTVDSISELHAVATRLWVAYEGADSDKDGNISQTECLAAGMQCATEGSHADDDLGNVPIVELVRTTIAPLSQSMCKVLREVQTSTSLANQLCGLLEEEAKNILSGGNQADFLGLWEKMAGVEATGAKAEDSEETEESQQSVALVEEGETAAEGGSTSAQEEDAGEIYMNDSMFATLKKKERKAGDQIAWGAVIKAVNKLFMADFCWKDVWARGMAGRICKSGWSQGGLLCYPHCPSGYRRFGEHCWQDCPGHMNDVGTHCQREYWKEHCWGWACVWTLEIETRGKDVKHKPSCMLTSSTCSQCPSGHYENAAACYKHAKPGYRCHGAELTCHRDCTAPLGTDCGGGCAMDTPSCVANTIEMVQGLIEAAVQTAVLVMSFGSSATATAMGNAAKNSMKTAAKRNARRTAIKVSREEFKKELRKTYIRIAKKAVKDAVMGKVDAKKQELMEQYAMRGADGMAEAYMQKVEQQGKNPALIAVKEVDITGLVDAIDTSVSGDASANKQAAKWMNVIGTVDPTGILGAVANFVKHDHCEAVQKKLDEAENKRLTAPATQDLFCEPCYCWNKVNNHYSNCWWWKSWFGPPHQVYCTYGAGNAAVFRRPDPCPDA